MKAARRGICALVMVVGAIAFAGQAKAQKLEAVDFGSDKSSCSGLVAVPDKPGRYPAIIVIHEWWGVNDWVKDQTNKLATAGFVALAVDLYHGKVATDSSEAQDLLYSVSQEQAVAELTAAYNYLMTRKDVDRDRIAAIGWGSGAGYALQLAMHEPHMAACVVNYGALPTDPNDLLLIGAAVLGNFGADDKGVTAADAQGFEKMMTSQGKLVDVKIYDGVGHGFANPEDVDHYNEQAAADAWSRTIKFLNKMLR